MILDKLLQFSSGQDLGQVAGTYTSTNIVDIGIGLQTTANPSGLAIPGVAAGGGARDLGIGDGLKLLVQVIEAFTSGGAATLQVVLQGAVDNGAGAPAAFSSWWSSPVYALATLNAGSRLLDIDMPRPPDGIAMPRYLQLSYIIGTATTTAGTVDAYVLGDRDDQIYNATDNSILGGYPAGITVAN